MGQEESRTFALNPRDGNYALPLSNDWRYTIQSIPIVDRVVTINDNQYKFGPKLGTGGFGSVYAARHLPDNSPVAIKVVSLATMHNAEAEGLSESILNEIRMAKFLAKLSKHVVHMYDFDFHRHTGLSFIIMELGEQDLEAALLQRPPLSSVERKAIWRQLVDIAITLYRRQIVHLDIKPQNLVMFPGNIVKLVDLGIAQKAYRKRIGPNGTPPYSAPEVTNVSFFHMTMNTTKADVWSWGAVLYRLTYSVPPTYDSPCYRPPSNQYASRDPHLVDILRHTLVINPRDRPDAPWLAQHRYTRTP